MGECDQPFESLTDLTLQFRIARLTSNMPSNDCVASLLSDLRRSVRHYNVVHNHLLCHKYSSASRLHSLNHQSRDALCPSFSTGPWDYRPSRPQHNHLFYHLRAMHLTSRRRSYGGHDRPYHPILVVLRGWLGVVLYALRRRVVVFSNVPPSINEYELETFGIVHSPEEFWSIRTVVEGGVLVDPTVSTRRRERQKEHPSRDRCVQNPDGVMDDTFDIATPGKITTKTTITVTTEPRTVALREGIVELPGFGIRPNTGRSHAPSDRSVAHTTMGHMDGRGA